MVRFDKTPDLLSATKSHLNQFSKADSLLTYCTKRPGVCITTQHFLRSLLSYSIFIHNNWHIKQLLSEKLADGITVNVRIRHRIIEWLAH